MQTRINRDKYVHFVRYKIIGAPKNLKTGRVSHVSLELTMHVL